MKVCTARGRSLGRAAFLCCHRNPTFLCSTFWDAKSPCLCNGVYMLERGFGASSGESPSTCAGKATSLELWLTWLCLLEPSRRSSCNRGEMQVRRQPLLGERKKGFESKAQLCFPVLAFVLWLCFPPQLSDPLPRGSWQPCLLWRHRVAIVSAQMDKQTGCGLGAHRAAP